MKTRIRIKPARAGLIVRFPGNPARMLRADGEEVVKSSYWIRRIADGDVEYAPESKIKLENVPAVAPSDEE